MSDGKKGLGRVKFGAQIAPDAHVAVHRQNGEDRPMVVRAAQEGEPVPPGGGLMQVDPTCDGGWHDVTFHYRNGPAQVATPAYREGYDRIFGKKQEPGLA